MKKRPVRRQAPRKTKKEGFPQGPVPPAAKPRYQTINNYIFYKFYNYTLTNGHDLVTLAIEFPARTNTYLRRKISQEETNAKKIA